MARLKVMPDRKRVDRMKGIIDYYYWLDIPVARIWPRWPKRKPSPEERANQQDFARIVRIISELPPDIIEAYQWMARGTPYTWRDLAISLAMRRPRWHSPVGKAP